MMKANMKKMVFAAIAAACMVSASAMAEEAEDIIVDESFEAVEETTAAPEVQGIEIEVIGFETIATAEVPEEAAAEVEEQISETEAVETETTAREFFFENDEVIITAQAELPENAELQARKLEAGSEEYEAAKQIAAQNTEADDEAQYSFYDVTFTVDGEEVETDTAMIQIQFKTVQIGTTDVQNILKIDENGATDVTAQTEAGSNMSSVSFGI